MLCEILHTICGTHEAGTAVPVNNAVERKHQHRRLVTVTLRTVNASCGALQIPTKSGLRKVTGVLLKPQRNSGHEQFRAVSFAR